MRSIFLAFASTFVLINAHQVSFKTQNDLFVPPPSQNALNWWSALMDSTRDVSYSHTTAISNSVFFASIPAGTYLYYVSDSNTDFNGTLSTTVWVTATPSGAIERMLQSRGSKSPVFRIYQLKQGMHNILWFPGLTNMIDSYEGPLKMIVDASDDTLIMARKFCEIAGAQGWAMNTEHALEWMLCNDNNQLDMILELVSESKESHRAYLHEVARKLRSSHDAMNIHLGLAVLMEKYFRPNSNGTNKPTLPLNIKLQFRQYWRDVFLNQRCQDDRANPSLLAIEQQMVKNWIEHGTRWRSLFSMSSSCREKETLSLRYQCFVSEYHVALLPFGVGEVASRPSSVDLKKIEHRCRYYHRHLVEERPNDSRCTLTAMTYASIRGAFWEIAPWICQLALQAMDWNMEAVIKSKDEHAMNVTMSRMEDIKKQWENAFGVRVK